VTSPPRLRGEKAAEIAMDNTIVNTNVKKRVILLIFVLFIFGCETIPKGPLEPDEVRLTNLKIIETGEKSRNGKLYKAIIRYRHEEKTGPGNIKSACTTWTWLWET
jgi:hypothetical protein